MSYRFKMLEAGENISGFKLLRFLGYVWLQCSKKLCELGHLQFFRWNILRCNISESQPLLVMCNVKKEDVEWKEHQSLNNRWSYYLAFWVGEDVCLSPAAIYNLGLLLLDPEERSKLKREEMNSSSTSSQRKLPAINPARMSSHYKWVCFLEFARCPHNPHCSSWSNLPFAYWFPMKLSFEMMDLQLGLDLEER